MENINRNIKEINYDTTSGVYTINGEVCDKERVDNFSGIANIKINGIITYHGSVINGKPNGQGTEFYKNGKTVKYEGYFTNGEYNGQGTLYLKNGKKYYSGNFRNDKFHGQGTIYREDGSERYSSYFILDKYNGYFTYYTKQGEFIGQSKKKRNILLK
ncbi:MAG: hypothetical protein IJ853_00090 [Rickettsiales bacterium]|nr:hypothetical protein [Rickettsiales bacterium]